MFPPFPGFFDPIGDRSQSDHGRSLPKFRPRPPGPTSLDGGYILRAGGIKSRSPFLSPRWTLVQRKAEGYLYSAHGMNHSIIATKNIAAVANADQTARLLFTSIRLSPDFRDALDRWSRLQPDKPSRSEAIRRIVERSIVRKT
jgi:hypothetical protein